MLGFTRNQLIAFIVGCLLPIVIGQAVVWYIIEHAEDALLLWLERRWPSTPPTPPDLTLVKGGVDEVLH